MVGGAFLCFEGVEKLAHRYLHSPAEQEAHHDELAAALADPSKDLVAVERDKIKGAVRTDFVLSAEIIVIALGTVATAAFATRLAVLASIAAIMTVGVYGLVAGIVKLDDAGLHLSRKDSAGAQALGRAILAFAPWLMKALSVAGTAAMFLVGGGILVHGIGPAHHAIESLVAAAGGAGWLVSLLGDAAVGIFAGALVLGAVVLGKGLFSRKPTAS